MLETSYCCFHLTSVACNLSTEVYANLAYSMCSCRGSCQSGAVLTHNIKYSSVVIHMTMIKVIEDWVPERLKITDTTTVLTANTIYLGINSWWNEYILFYSWEDDDRCLWQVWCLHTSFIVLSITSFGTWNIHVPKKSKSKTNSQGEMECSFNFFE